MSMLGLKLNGIMIMATLSPPVPGRAPVLLTQTRWAQNEALSFISSIVRSNFYLLDDEQKNRYPNSTAKPGQLSRRSKVKSLVSGAPSKPLSCHPSSVS